MNCSLRRTSHTIGGFERQAEFEVQSKDNAQIGVINDFFFKSASSKITSVSGPFLLLSAHIMGESCFIAF